MKIAFDIDDTLIVPNVAQGYANDTPNYDTIAILRWFQAQGHEIILWSGSGNDWAHTWGEKLGLQPFTVMKKEKVLTLGDLKEPEIDIAFDDCDVDLAKVNIKVKRVNNSVSRAEWNKTNHEKYLDDRIERYNASKEAGTLDNDFPLISKVIM